MCESDSLTIPPGDLLQEPDGSISTIIESRREEHPEGIAVYNFSVYEVHTYFVREEGSTAEPVWEHNASPQYGTNKEGKVTSRSKFRAETLEDCWDDAVDGPNGGKLCPTCGVEVFAEPGMRPRDWDVSHLPSWTNRKFAPTVTRAKVIDNYQEGTFLECPGCNRPRGNND